VHVISEGRRQQPDTVASLPEDPVGLFEHRHPRPFQVAGIDAEVLLLRQHFQPVIQPPDHDRADRPHGRDVFAFPLPPAQPGLERLGHRETLREGETNRGVDADAPVGGLLNRRNPRPSHRNLHDHIRRKLAEMDRLLDDGLGIAVQARVSLDGKAPVLPLLALKNGLKQCGRLRGDFLHQLPRNLVLGGGRHLFDELGDAILPERHFFLEHLDHDHRVAGGPDRPVLEGIGQLPNRGGIVPQTSGRRLGHFMQRALISRCGKHTFTPGNSEETSPLRWCWGIDSAKHFENYP